LFPAYRSGGTADEPVQPAPERVRQRRHGVQSGRTETIIGRIRSR
jgi:hypothetical protein